MSEAESFSAEGKKRKTGFRKCSKCGDTGHNAPKCVNPQYYEALARKEEMLEQIDYAIKEFTSHAKEYSLDKEYGMAKMIREDATDMKKLRRMIENNHFGKARHFARGLDSSPREYAPGAFWDIWGAEESYCPNHDETYAEGSFCPFCEVERRNKEDSLYGNAESFAADGTIPPSPFLDPDYCRVIGSGKYRFNQYGTDGKAWRQYRFKTKDEAMESLSGRTLPLGMVKPGQDQYDFPPKQAESFATETIKPMTIGLGLGIVALFLWGRNR